MENSTRKVFEDSKRGSMNKNEGVWKVVTGRKSPSKKEVSPKNQTQDFRRNDLGNGSSSNSFEILVAAGDSETVAT